MNNREKMTASNRVEKIQGELETKENECDSKIDDLVSLVGGDEANLDFSVISFPDFSKFAEFVE
jgi:hypothetical protein